MPKGGIASNLDISQTLSPWQDFHMQYCQWCEHMECSMFDDPCDKCVPSRFVDLREKGGDNER